MTIDTSLGATIPTNVGHTKHEALLDTATTRSCMIKFYYHTLMQLKLRYLLSFVVRSASRNILQSMTLVTVF